MGRQSQAGVLQVPDPHYSHHKDGPANLKWESDKCLTHVTTLMKLGPAKIKQERPSVICFTGKRYNVCLSRTRDHTAIEMHKKMSEPALNIRRESEPAINN